MSIPLEQKLDEIRKYLSSPGKKVILIGEEHNASSYHELIDIIGKIMKIMDLPKMVGKDCKIYFEMQREDALKALQFKNPEPVPAIEGNIVRFLSLTGVEPNYPTFNRAQCKKNNDPSRRLGDRQYAGDIRALLENTDIVIGLFGLGHLYMLSELLAEYHPCTVNMTPPNGIKAVKETWYSMFREIRMPDFDRLYPMVIDESAANRGKATVDVWFQAHTQPIMAQKPVIPQKPPKMNEATARGMKVSQLKKEMALRQINDSGMLEKEDFVRALVNWQGGKVRRSIRRKHTRRKARKTKQK
jgi:hypothetical protein